MSRTKKTRRIGRVKPTVLRSLPALRERVGRFRAKGESVALVPTMGALHGGHVALVRHARRRAQRVVVSIFVNPAQFAPNEDFANYPRAWDTDLAALTELAVEVVWAPSLTTMYPDGFGTSIVPAGPALAGLEDMFRPHFFQGVATVVAKLLVQAAPDFAVFGEKDFQQLKVVTAMARDLDIPVKIVGVPTVRERDGLAMSSRNAYLSASERATAPTLYRVLKECAARLKAGQPVAATVAQARKQIEDAGFVVDYFEARHAATLAPINTLSDGPVRLLVAARLGSTRLIDNIAV
jgi:pantoate--beta-alanine ligase